MGKYSLAFKKKCAILSSNVPLQLIVSESRRDALLKNCSKFKIPVLAVHIFESLEPSLVSSLVVAAPTLFSVSGQNSLAPYSELILSTDTLVSEFLCWKYTESFTPHSFAPAVDWEQVMPLLENNATKRLLESGYADEYLSLWSEASETPTLPELCAFETLSEALFRPKIPTRTMSWYENSDVYLSSGEVVLDCGACSTSSGGQFTSLFSERVGQTGRVYALEPVKKIYDELCVETKHLDNVKVLNYAIGSSDQMTSLIADGLTSRVSDTGTDDVKMISLDREFLSGPINYIKMDIEGSESRALSGAQKLIRSQSPKLAICVYHSPLDFTTIPKYIASLSSYRFWLELNEGNVWSGMKLLAKSTS